jgi:hypothetical protein
LSINWQADDPNGDQLVYSLFLKAEDEQEWHLLKKQLHETSFVVEPNTLAEGKYVARLVASDEESNSPSTARQTELLSAPFWVDNTPPQVKASAKNITPAGTEVHFQVESNIAPLRSAEFSIDGKEWRNVNSDDGIVDSRLETFTISKLALEPGEHIVALRAYDSAGNTGIGKAVVYVPHH